MMISSQLDVFLSVGVMGCFCGVIKRKGKDRTNG